MLDRSIENMDLRVATATVEVNSEMEVNIDLARTDVRDTPPPKVS